MTGVRAIGGYFEIEPTGTGRGFPVPDGYFVNSGRNAFELILASIAQVSKVYVPYYTCPVVYEPLKKLGIPYSFYSVDSNLEIDSEIILNEDEYLLYTNYLGIKDNYVRQLAKKYGRSLIIDCSQALYAPQILGTKAFYSPRKFVGVPDGGIAICDSRINLDAYEQDDSSDRMEHLFLRRDFGPEAGYSKFKENDAKLVGQPIKRMSRQTANLLNEIDFVQIIERRIRNFNYLHSKLGHLNQLDIPAPESFACPLVYPLLVSNGEVLRQKLIDNKIFVAKYWPDIPSDPDRICKGADLVNNLLAIPLDQRYGITEMEFICAQILN